MRILGIDPGISRIGYGLIEYGSDIKILKYGVIETRSREGAERLQELGAALFKLIGECAPERVGVECLYFAKNRKTALAVSEARGVILKTIMDSGVPITELSPNTVKKALTGYGLAGKEAVAKMVKKILRVRELRGHDDASDALAIAIAAGQTHNYS